ncbi:Glucose oxidase [Cytospora mali]|uniref:Glucose oxidase n=1 Tax=Cytospora mali TaxID=578113 RepID=A0A194VT44_CYTMA|nr:Glucose oxidase [Valsa mali]
MKTIIPLSLLASTAAARPGQLKSHANTSVYDYVVVGGGTSGLVVANRLSEDPSVSVLVIERGGSVLNNPNVTDVNGYGYAFGTEIDYAFETAPQAYANNASTTMRAAKALGGTSTINGMAYTRAEASQIDVWETLGNEGWNWDALFPYYLKSETFTVPDAARIADGHFSYDPEYHGKNGPLHTGFVYGDTNSTYPVSMNETYQALGVPWNEDSAGGSMVGFSAYPKTVDQELNIRWDAARSYYYPYSNRTNLKVLLNTTANKITWAEGGLEATAEGVEITAADGTVSVVKASKEVILSAGALTSPLLLELSGVGNPTILSQYGIETVVDLPTVGENLQDQMNNELKYQPPNSFSASYDNGSAQLVAYPSAAHVWSDDESATASDLKSKLAEYADAVAIANGNVTKASDLLEFFKLQYDLIFEDEIPYAEVLIYISAGVWGAEYWGLLPFSRGSIHITSGNSTENAYINPNYFMLDYDVDLQVSVAKFIRKIFGTGSFAELAGTETTPSFESVAEDAEESSWKTWAVSKYRSNFHPVATNAMMPKEKGGVVNSNLTVYGTSNVRVVDASILPFQVCGHLVSTLYAVSERASDLIKAAAS